MKTQFTKIIALSILLTAATLSSCENTSKKKLIEQYKSEARNQEKQSKPQDFQAEIEDVVKYTIASTNIYAEKTRSVLSGYAFDYYICGTENSMDMLQWDMDKFDNLMTEMFEADDGETAYRKALSKVANDNSNDQHGNASRVLKEYDKTYVVLSNYKKVSTSSDVKLWEFREINTN